MENIWITTSNPYFLILPYQSLSFHHGVIRIIQNVEIIFQRHLEAELKAQKSKLMQLVAIRQLELTVKTSFQCHIVFGNVLIIFHKVQNIELREGTFKEP